MYAYNRGYDDYYFGIDYNPYYYGTAAFFDWEDGWWDAYDDHHYRLFWY